MNVIVLDGVIAFTYIGSSTYLLFALFDDETKFTLFFFMLTLSSTSTHISSSISSTLRSTIIIVPSILVAILISYLQTSFFSSWFDIVRDRSLS